MTQLLPFKPQNQLHTVSGGSWQVECDFEKECNILLRREYSILLLLLFKQGQHLFIKNPKNKCPPDTEEANDNERKG